MSNGWIVSYILLSSVMMILAVISCLGGELIKTVLFTGISIWVLLGGLLFKGCEQNG